MIKNVCGSSPLLAALGSLASVFLLASPAKGATIAVDYVTSYSSLFGSDSITYNSANGLSQFLGTNLGGTTVTFTTVASTPSTSVLGLTASSTALAATRFNPQTGRTGTASASSYANLSTGMIGAGAAGSVLSGATIAGEFADAGAQMQDSITFNNTSGQTVNIDVFWTFDGTMPTATSGDSMTSFFCLGTGASCLSAPGPPGGLNGPGNNLEFFSLIDSLGLGYPTDPFITEPTAGFAGASFTPSINADSGTFHGVFPVPVGISTDSLNAYFNIQCFQATCDFTHTGALSFGGLGNGVSFTSGSGVLLSQSGAAPEPGSWILMAAGVGLIGLAKLRKPSLD